jgi:hypothetical protein
MASFVNLHKVIVESAFSAFPSAQNEVELEGGAKSERLKWQFSQVEVEWIWIYKKSLNRFPFQ